MNSDAFKDIEKLETDLWEAADNLRANSKLTSSDYFMPVLGRRWSGLPGHQGCLKCSTASLSAQNKKSCEMYDRADMGQ